MPINEHAGFPFTVRNIHNHNSFLDYLGNLSNENNKTLVVGVIGKPTDVDQLANRINTNSVCADIVNQYDCDTSLDVNTIRKNQGFIKDHFTDMDRGIIIDYNDNYCVRMHEVVTKKICLKKDLQVRQKDFNNNIDKKANPFGSSKHNKRRRKDFLSRVKKRRLKKRK